MLKSALDEARTIVGNMGSVIAENDYEPFGKQLKTWYLYNNGDIVPTQGFIGKELDSESDLADHGVRKYDYITGRFMAVDPLWEKYRAFNTYQYAANNPIVAKDPNGRLIEDSKGNIVFIAVGKEREMDYENKIKVLFQPGIIYTDKGNPITAYKNLSGDIGFDSDCHGLSLAKGQLWIDNIAVPMILDQEYEKPKDGVPQVGSIVVYYDAKGNVVHSSIVSAIDGNSITVTEDRGNAAQNTTTSLDESIHYYAQTKKVEFFNKKPGVQPFTDEEIKQLTENVMKSNEHKEDRNERAGERK